MTTAILATVAGLATWAFVGVVLAVLANIIAICALVQSSQTAVQVRALTEDQSRRIDALDERRGD